MKIIIVDDEMSALHTFLSDVIDRTDVDYKFFRDDLSEIEEYLQFNDITAAFLDISMPNISGVTLAKRLIELRPRIKIVFITGLNLSKADLEADVSSHTLGFLYKPYDADELEMYLSELKSDERRLKAQMFGAFDCFVGDRLVKFSSGKSKELFALLLTYNGKTLTMTDAISQLWPDLYINKSKPLYRDAVWRLRKTLNEIGVDCVDFERAQLVLKKDFIDCDYWDYLAHLSSRQKSDFHKGDVPKGDSSQGNSHKGDVLGNSSRGDFSRGDFPTANFPRGDFLKSYTWSIDYLPPL